MPYQLQPPYAERKKNNRINDHQSGRWRIFKKTHRITDNKEHVDNYWYYPSFRFMDIVCISHLSIIIILRNRTRQHQSHDHPVRSTWKSAQFQSVKNQNNNGSSNNCGYKVNKEQPFGYNGDSYGNWLCWFVHSKTDNIANLIKLHQFSNTSKVLTFLKIRIDFFKVMLSQRKTSAIHR